MNVRVFTYGTLTFPELMAAVTGRDFPLRDAVLDGYRCALLAGRWYPGITRASGYRTTGVLYDDVDPDSVTRLDAYESDAYERVEVAVRLPDGGRAAAQTYVVGSGFRSLLGEETWDRDRFAIERLPSLL